jgi:predicted nucleotidyltransferase
MSTSAGFAIDGRPVDQTRLAEVCRRYGVAELAVFGSAARGETTPESDVDVLYVLAPGAKLGFGINRLEDELSELFGRPVDLVAKKALHRLLRDEVTAQARTLYAA